MPKESVSGTKMWCPGCREVTPCAALAPYPNNRELQGQRGKRIDSAEIHWFARRRVCQTCGHEFETVEIEHDLPIVLIKLRETMHEIKEKAETLIRWHKT
jgi:hypothetical protein